MFEFLLKEKLKIQSEIGNLETKYLELKRKLMFMGSAKNEHFPEAFENISKDLMKLNEIKTFYFSILDGYNDLTNELNEASDVVSSIEEELSQIVEELQLSVPDFVDQEKDEQFVDSINGENKENSVNQSFLNSSSDKEYSPRVFIHKSCIKLGEDAMTPACKSNSKLPKYRGQPVVLF